MNTSKYQKYAYTSSDVVALTSYYFLIVDNYKYLMLELKNNVNDELTAIKFELKEYNKDKKLLKTHIITTDINISNYNIKLLEKKLLLDDSTTKIEYRLLEAVFKNKIYKDNNFLLDTNFKLSNVNNRTYLSPLKTAEKPINNKKIQDKRKKEFKVKDYSTINKNKKSFIFISLLFIIVCVLTAFTFIEYNKSGDLIYYKDKYSLSFENETDGLYVSKFEGSADIVTIPVEFKNKPVVGIKKDVFKDEDILEVFIDGNENSFVIESNAFLNSKIRKIASNNEIVISNCAFANCSDLAFVNLPETKIVSSEAFSNCKALNVVELNDATLSYNSFNNVKNINSLSFKDLDCMSLYECFNINTTINNLVVNMSYIEANTFKNIIINNLRVDDNTLFIEYNALDNIKNIENIYKDNYNEQIYLNNKLVGINSKATTLVLDNKIRNFDNLEYLFNIINKQIKKVEVKVEINNLDSLLNNLILLEELSIENIYSIDLSNIYNLNKLSIIGNISDDSLRTINDVDTLSISNMSSLFFSALDNININHLIIDSCEVFSTVTTAIINKLTFKNISTYELILNQLNVKYLDFENVNNVFIEDINNLEYIKNRGSNNLTIINCNKIYYLDADNAIITINNNPNLKVLKTTVKTLPYINQENLLLERLTLKYNYNSYFTYTMFDNLKFLELSTTSYLSLNELSDFKYLDTVVLNTQAKNSNFFNINNIKNIILPNNSISQYNIGFNYNNLYSNYISNSINNVNNIVCNNNYSKDENIISNIKYNDTYIINYNNEEYKYNCSFIYDITDIISFMIDNNIYLSFYNQYNIYFNDEIKSINTCLLLNKEDKITLR